MVVHPRWAFQVLQSSAETLFRWGWNYLYDFAANLCGNDVPDFTKIAWVL